MSIILSHLFMALFIGCLYWQVGENAVRMEDNAKLIFFNMVFISFCALSSTLHSCKTTFQTCDLFWVLIYIFCYFIAVPEELPIMTREHFNGWYGVFSLYMAKKFAYGIVTTTCTISYIVIVYFMTNQPIEINRIELILLQNFLIGLISQNVGIWFAAALNPTVWDLNHSIIIWFYLNVVYIFTVVIVPWTLLAHATFNVLWFVHPIQRHSSCLGKDIRLFYFQKWVRRHDAGYVWVRFKFI